MGPFWSPAVVLQQLSGVEIPTLSQVLTDLLHGYMITKCLVLT